MAQITRKRISVRAYAGPLNIFQQILHKGDLNGIKPNSVDSVEWFRKQASSFRTATPSRIIAGTVNDYVDRPKIGHMYMYQYDPKTKEELPYYDSFPLIFLIGQYKDGFLGINLHYLPLPLRAKLMDALYDVTNNKKFDETTKLKINYGILKAATKYRYFKPCVKRYLTKHVRTRFIHVAPESWDTALFLPLQRFKKASAGKVWADSKAMF